MFHSCRNQVVGFYKRGWFLLTLPQVFENQLPGLSISGTLAENGWKISSEYVTQFREKLRI